MAGNFVVLPPSITDPFYTARPFINQMMSFALQANLQKRAHEQRLEIVDRRIEMEKVKEAKARQEKGEQNVYELQKEGRVTIPSQGAEGMLAEAAGMPQEPITKTYFGKKPEKLTQAGLQRKTKRFTVGKQAWGQDYNFNPKTGEDVPVGEPYPMPPGQKIDIAIDMTKKTQADLEEQIVKGKETLSKLDRVKKLYRPEFLEYMGKSKAWIQNKASKAGMPTGKYLKNYSKWKAEVDAHTFMWRKFITGVAGGEKEMEAIERTTINTKYDSPASFEAKLEQIKIMTDAAIARSKFLLERGFDIKKATPEQKAKIAEDYPLEQFGYKEKAPGQSESEKESYDYEYVPGRGMLPVLR